MIKKYNMSTSDQDHYNYPTLNRKDLMFPSTFSSNDTNKKKFKGGLDTNRDYSHNLLNVDIAGKILHNLKEAHPKNLEF